jgi:uncharacterized protein (TIGR00661 family)
MKILYAVQATGNGHISRAHQLYPYLAEYGEVDVFLSGSNATLPVNFPVKYKSKGLSLFYSKCGGLDYSRIFKMVDIRHVLKMAKELPVENYDLILNDFEHITSRACRLKNKPSVQFGHQASFMSEKTPRPNQKKWAGEWILKKYAPATHYVGLHFEQYDDFIFHPVIKGDFIGAQPEDHGHISIYLPAYKSHCIETALLALDNIRFHWFLPEVELPFTQGNITYMPVRQDMFNESLMYCRGLITGGGFETPAEALYLGKRLMSIPISGQYEQECNAAALAQRGVTVLRECGDDFAQRIENWLNINTPLQRLPANNIKETLDYIMHLNGAKVKPESQRQPA